MRKASRLVRPLVFDRGFAAIVLVFAVALAAAPLVVESLLSGAGTFRLTWAEGFLGGFFVAVFLAAALYLALIYTGANSYVVGAIGESWTAEELAKLGAEWRHFRNVRFVEGHGESSYQIDVDHIAVGPCGVVVVETKFSTGEVDLTTGTPGKLVDSAVNQASRNGGRVRALLTRDAPSAPIVPTLVFWGPRVIEPPGGVRRYGDVWVLAGRSSAAWQLELRTPRCLSDDEIDAIATKIRRYAASMANEEPE